MRNRDMPTQIGVFQDDELDWHYDGRGLTKLEVAAIAAMQGMLAHPVRAAVSASGESFNMHFLARQAADQANVLFDELDATEAADETQGDDSEDLFSPFCDHCGRPPVVTCDYDDCPLGRQA